MGFLYVRAGPFGIEFADSISQELQALAATESTPDDQKAANQVLLRWGIRWDSPMRDHGLISDRWSDLLSHLNWKNR